VVAATLLVWALPAAWAQARQAKVDAAQSLRSSADLRRGAGTAVSSERGAMRLTSDGRLEIERLVSASGSIALQALGP
jgi:hypothetical protein